MPGVAGRCSAVGRRGPISRTVGGSRSGRRSVRPSVSSCSAGPVSGAPSSEASPPGDPVFGVGTSGWPPAAASTPTVSSVGAAVTGRRCGEGPAAATSGSVGCGAAAGSGRALAAHAASMAMSGSSSARSSAPARPPPLRASMSASSARTAARSIGSSLSRGSKSRSSSMSAGPASRSKSTSSRSSSQLAVEVTADVVVPGRRGVAGVVRFGGPGSVGRAHADEIVVRRATVRPRLRHGRVDRARAGVVAVAPPRVPHA